MNYKKYLIISISNIVLFILNTILLFFYFVFSYTGEFEFFRIILESPFYYMGLSSDAVIGLFLVFIGLSIFGVLFLLTYGLFKLSNSQERESKKYWISGIIINSLPVIALLVYFIRAFF